VSASTYSCNYYITIIESNAGYAAVCVARDLKMGYLSCYVHMMIDCKSRCSEHQQCEKQINGSSLSQIY
jgi:hypothetical protein